MKYINRMGVVLFVLLCSQTFAQVDVFHRELAGNTFGPQETPSLYFEDITSTKQLTNPYLGPPGYVAMGNTQGNICQLYALYSDLSVAQRVAYPIRGYHLLEDPRHDQFYILGKEQNEDHTVLYAMDPGSFSPNFQIKLQTAAGTPIVDRFDGKLLLGYNANELFVFGSEGNKVIMGIFSATNGAYLGSAAFEIPEFSNANVVDVYKTNDAVYILGDHFLLRLEVDQNYIFTGSYHYKVYASSHVFTNEEGMSYEHRFQFINFDYQEGYFYVLARSNYHSDPFYHQFVPFVLKVDGNGNLVGNKMYLGQDIVDFQNNSENPKDIVAHPNGTLTLFANGGGIDRYFTIQQDLSLVRATKKEHQGMSNWGLNGKALLENEGTGFVFGNSTLHPNNISFSFTHMHFTKMTDILSTSCEEELVVDLSSYTVFAIEYEAEIVRYFFYPNFAPAVGESFEYEEPIQCADVLYGSEAEKGMSNLKEETEVSSKQITIFPNPSSGLINIEISGNLEPGFSWQLFDLTGREVKTGVRLNPDISHLPKGMYLLKVQNGIKQFQKKITLN